MLASGSYPLGFGGTSMLSLRTQSRLFFTGFILSSFIAALGFYSAIAAPKVIKVAKTDNLASIISEGAELERAHKWPDAIDLYKTLLKEYPDTPELTYGLRRSKIHFSIERRYTDKSFNQQLLDMSDDQLFRLYDEVMSYIQNSYIDKVVTTYFIAHGTESLYLALNNEKFLTRNLPQTSSSDIQQFRNVLKSRYWNKELSGTDGDKKIILEIAGLADRYTGLKSNAVILEYIFGGFNSLDDYSSCMTPSKNQDMQNSIKGEFVGLGIELKAEEGQGMLLVNVLDGSPAQEGGLESGDYITSVDGNDCRNLSTEEAAGMLTGKSGSKVKLTWSRGKSVKELQNTFTRRQVAVKAVPLAFMIDENQKIGYVRLTSFQQSTATEIEQAIYRLEQQGMKSVILDLRGNPGGLLTGGVEVLDKFIDQGVLVSTRGRDFQDNLEYSAHRLGTYNGPMVLLVDGNSASASEMVAGGIKDHERGKLVGRTTYGKWSVQSIFTISNSLGLRLSTAKFYSPKGGWYGKVGVEPDYKVDADPKAIIKFTKQELPQDPDVLKALEILTDPLYTSR